MPRILRYRGGHPAPSRKVFIAIPSFGDVCPDFTIALAESVEALTAAGMAHEVVILHGNCHVDDSRNYLVREFLESDADDFFFLDADLKWDADDLVRMVQVSPDVVAGIYPLKQETEDYPVRHLPGEIWSNAEGLIPVESVPTGFLRIRRGVLEAMDKTAKHHRNGNDKPGRRLIPLIFERSLSGEDRWGGDYTFCLKWNAMGGRIFIDAEMDFSHIGGKVYEGNYGSFLRRSNGLSMAYAINALKNGKETPKILFEMSRAWDSAWSVRIDGMGTLAMLARESERVLEYGSGLSSIVMAACGAHVTTVEHDPAWAKKIRAVAEEHSLPIEVVDCEIADRGDYAWYDAEIEGDFDLTVLDGPPRSTKGHRIGFFKESLPERGTLFVDDAEDPKIQEMIEGLNPSYLGEVAVCNLERVA